MSTRYGVLALQPVRCFTDDRVGGLYDVAGGAVVLRHVGRVGLVVLLEAPDVLGGGAAERVYVLVVVPHGEDIELVLLPAVLPREGRNQLVLGLLDVLVFVDQHPAEPAQQPVPELVALLHLTGAPAGQPPGGLLEYLVEDLAGLLVGAGLVALEGAAHQPHGQRVAGQDRHSTALVADQFP